LSLTTGFVCVKGYLTPIKNTILYYIFYDLPKEIGKKKTS